ncbi:MAG TPA: beta-ketoacyl-[acyl-carrier-protein] synthase family protein [Nitrospirota bacterium]
MRRVAVTGVGVISPVGNTAEVFFHNLAAGRSGIRRLSSNIADRLEVKVAAESTFSGEDYYSKKQLGLLDRTSQMALAAASQAWTDSGLELNDVEKQRSGVYLGTGMGGANSLDEMFGKLYRENAGRVSPLFVAKIMSNAPASHISIQYGLSGPCLTFSTACSSSAVSIGEAFRQINAGHADIILAGGAESLLAYGSFKCWESLGVLAPEEAANPAASCRPFSMDRAGFVLGEGAAVVVLEEMERARRRGAQIYAEIAGYGSTSDAHHITSPSVGGQARAMRLALEEAGSSIDQIDYINAHGTATAKNDLVETQAIKEVFGGRAKTIPASSTKSMHGHLLGAAGAVEFVAALLAMKHETIPPTAHLRVPDPECDLDYVPNAGRTGVRVRTIMSNSFAFGGTNAVLVAKAV